ncbi:MAG TPA: type IV secretory system conjugative DNA transfer family protein [Mariprofundaceae bacterium]|nr:type IV secretory system conjugative DNA transfer family protein [Mariprofundaceae bacterium]
MGELLNGLLKLLVYGCWVFLLFAGLYFSAAGWVADAQRDNWIQQYRITDNQAYRQKISGLYSQWEWFKLARYAAMHPCKTWAGIQNIWPILKDPVQAIGSGNFQPKHMTQERFIRHLVPPLLIAIIMALWVEFALYPLARHKLAAWLASTDRKIFGRLGDFPRGDGFVLSKHIRLNRKASFRHALVIGPSGAYKSSAMIIPTLLTLPDNCAAVISDPKFELYCRTSSWLQSRGHEVVIVSPLGGFGVGWDPLKECECSDDVRDLASQIISAAAYVAGKEPGEWQQMSESLLASYLVEASERRLSIAHAIESLYSDKASGTWLKSKAARFDFAMFQAGAAKSDKTAGSAIFTIQGALRQWCRDQVAGFLQHGSRLDMREIRRKKAVVFLCSTANESRQSAAIQNVFWRRLLSVLATQAGEPSCFCLLDEFANVGRLEGIDQGLNLLRSAGVGIFASIQNPPQLDFVYGRDGGALVLSSFGTVAVLPGLRDAERVSQWLGMKDDVRQSFSTMDEHMRAQFSQAPQNAMEAPLIRQLKDKQVLIVHANRKPVIDTTQVWFQTKLKKRVPIEFRKDWDQVNQDLVRKFLVQTGRIEPKQLSISPGIQKSQICPSDNLNPRKQEGIDMDNLFYQEIEK